MCGIVGYVGGWNATEIILGGLSRLEYRGYDSAGLAVVGDGELAIRRSLGKIQSLAARLEREPARGTIGLGHTRWATHGRPSEANAHPHADCSGSLVVVHNGIIENYLPLKERLLAAGHRFRSETDTEVVAHLVEEHLRTGAALPDAVAATVAQIRGAYAVAVLSRSTPDQIVAVRQGAGGIIVGVGEGEAFLASDIPALLPYTREMIVLEEGDLAVITTKGTRLTGGDGRRVDRPVVRIAWDAARAEKGGYPHFMLKEIHEQPRAVTDTFRGRLDETGVVLPDARLAPEVVGRLRRVTLVACGTSYHAALVGRTMVEALAGLPADVDIASEFRYRDLVLGPETLLVAISQSGETADTLGAVKAARGRGAPVLAITNVVGSALAREADHVLYTQAGPEIGVASTKTFTATVTACYLLALALGSQREFLPPLEAHKRSDELQELPDLMQRALRLDAQILPLARALAHHDNFLYLGRGVQHPVALEGALKLKEVSYIHAEGYAAGEMKHGPIALIADGLPVIALAPRDASYDRMLGNVEEVRARGGTVVAVCHEGDVELAARADHVLTIPVTGDLLAPLVSVIPLQLLAYQIAALRGLDVDQPRNLAKSVTVE